MLDVWRPTWHHTEYMALFQTLFSDPWQFIIWLLAFLLTLSVHESAHALVSYWLGDQTAHRAGRITLNPLAHIDFLGFLALVTIGFGWGKPVPFNPYQLKYRRMGPVLVAGAGPVSNFVLAALAALLLRGLFPSLGAGNVLMQFLFVVVLLSIMLGLFNLVPLPPLDGSKALLAFFEWKRWEKARAWIEQRGPMLLLGLVLIGAITPMNPFGWLFSSAERVAAWLL